MPLLDHFHPPLSQQRFWESFHGAWSTALMGDLNAGVLPDGYFAQAVVHIGSRVEVDVATLESQGAAASRGNGAATATLARAWAPPAPAFVIPAVFPDEIEVQIFDTTAGPTLVAAIELISPTNKDRAEARRAFIVKCAAYLQTGVGLIVIDVVTNRSGNLHDELMTLLEQATEQVVAAPLYAVAYRPVRRQADVIEIWPQALELGAKLPILPLALCHGPTVPVDLEHSYQTACQLNRF